MRYGRALIGTGVVVCAAAALYGYAYYKYPPRQAEPVAAAPAVPSVPSAGPVALEPATPVDRATFDRCVRGSLPTAEDAQQRDADCSKAILTRQLSPDSLALARLIRGSARMALGEKVKAREDLRAALSRYDSLVDSRTPAALDLFRRAVAQDALGDTEKALYDYGRAIRVDPSAPPAFLSRGVLLATRKRAFERAIEDFNKVLVLEPNNVQALVRRGDTYSQLGETARALADLDRAISLAPQSTLAYFYRGLVHSRMNMNVAALADYNAALERNPRNVEALTSRAAIHSLNSRMAFAIQDLDAAVAIAKENPHVYFNRGFAYFAQGQYQKAIDDYTTAISLDPDFALAYNNRALARAVINKDLPLALADCDMALKLAPGNLDVRDTRGFVYLKLGDPALALNEYNAALARDPNRTTALFGSGLAKIRMGNIKSGEGDQAAARILDPEVDQQFAFYGLN
jgi:tetratricopeptide (TPR) repeat protein